LDPVGEGYRKHVYNEGILIQVQLGNALGVNLGNTFRAYPDPIPDAHPLGSVNLPALPGNSGMRRTWQTAAHKSLLMRCSFAWISGVLIALAAINTNTVVGQAKTDSLSTGQSASDVDDPSQLFSRVEVFNDLQHLTNGDYLNQTVLRTNLKIGKRFTTRLDIPYVYSSAQPPEGKNHSGLGDISFRLLGYRIHQSPLSAVTASIEVSLNTASSPLIGTGKNIIIPMVTYSRVVGQKKSLLIGTLSQSISVGGDENRARVNFTKMQAGVVHPWSKRLWSVFSSDWFLDYEQGGLSMNLEARMGYAQTKYVHFWVQAGAGVFGDFILRYQWSLEAGIRYLFPPRKR
jgi:hypothetical protein